MPVAHESDRASAHESDDEPAHESDRASAPDRGLHSSETDIHSCIQKLIKSEQILEDSGEVEAAKKHLALAKWLWERKNTESLLITKREDSYWRTAIIISYFVEAGRFKRYKKLLNINVAKETPSLADFAEALGKGFGTSSLKSYFWAGTVFRILLEAGKLFNTMPVNLEVTNLLYTMYKKSRGNKEIVVQAWTAASDGKSPESVTKPVFLDKIEADESLKHFLDPKKKKSKKTAEDITNYDSLPAVELGGRDLKDKSKDFVIAGLKRDLMEANERIKALEHQVKRLKSAPDNTTPQVLSYSPTTPCYSYQF